MRYRMIDELVEKVDERNIDEVGKELIGVSVDKCFIKSVANVNGTDLSKYKVIHKNDFAVSLMQVSRDAKIPIARLEEYDVAIMSPAYPIFRVKDTSVVLPEYLEMWFKRPEFDREAAFIAVGGVRGSMPWEEFVKMKLPVPSLDIQKNIVKSYKIIADRIALKQKINDNLLARNTANKSLSQLLQFRDFILIGFNQGINWCYNAFKVFTFLTVQRDNFNSKQVVLCYRAKNSAFVIEFFKLKVQLLHGVIQKRITTIFRTNGS